ncbi:hypothetical protein D3P09_11755 [Paenibacillus pinisoli]|uniref:Uncharacterized protein n=2 Tax=Paenibacillus pinisoli TaxID=1276110 RepID=A0A3A6PXE4_9BACL|nr:hypothetical protein D3P09_11755 [Paenibacillus pinisoli]
MIGDKFFVGSRVGTTNWYSSISCYDFSNDTFVNILNQSEGKQYPLLIGMQDALLCVPNAINQPINAYSLVSKQYDDNTIVVLKPSVHTGRYLTEFVSAPKLKGIPTRFATGFDDVYYFKDGKIQNVPFYYGTGSAWSQIK